MTNVFKDDGEMWLFYDDDGEEFFVVDRVLLEATNTQNSVE